MVADLILPDHFATLEMEKIGAIVSEHGGATSHGAIFARSLEIPLVTGAAGILDAVRPGELAIVDGSLGRVYLSPDEGLCREYERAQQRYAVAVEHLDALRSRPAETRDGRRIALTANVGLWADLRLVERHGAEGVGLFRTELLALAHRGFPRGGRAGAALRAGRRVPGAAAGDDPHPRSRRRQGGADPGPRERGESRSSAGARSASRCPTSARSARSCARSCAPAPTATCACCCR